MTDTLPDPARLLDRLLDMCARAGADAADARLTRSTGVSVEVRGGALETTERAEDQGVALRCFFGHRQAHVAGSDLSDGALADLAERSVAMARAVPEDPYCGLATPGELADPDNGPALDLDGDPEIALDALEADAVAAEAAALAVDGVRQVASCGAGWTRTERWVAASNGFAAASAAAASSLGLAAVGERDGRMERDYESRTTRYRADRPQPEEIGRIAGERTVARLGSRRLGTRRSAVIYDRRVSSTLLGAFLAAISGPSVARGISFLKHRRGEQVFAPGVSIIDDPFRPRGLGSRLHDGEGRPVRETRLIDDGVLTDWLLNGHSARQLGLSPNGFASMGFGDPPGVTPSNLFMAPGTRSPSEMMHDLGEGLLITDMFGPSINPNTGDYSVGVSGFWFEGGEIAYPVSEVTVAGDLPGMFARLEPASDLEFRSTRDAPSLLIEDLSIAGN